jgi:diguanylate cyclase (GGDEF)-like protein
MSLMARLVILIVAALLPVKAMEVYNRVTFYRAEARAVEQQTVASARLAAEAQAQLIQSSREFLRVIASLEAVRRQDRTACNETLRALAPHYPNYAFFGVVDRNGQRFCSSAEPYPGNVSLTNQSFFPLALKNRDFVVGDYRVSLVDRVPILDLGYPFYGENGAIEGVVYAGVSLKYLTDQLADRPMPEGAELIIADRKGVIIGSTGAPALIGKPLPASQAALLQRRAIGLTQAQGLDGVTRMFAYVPIDVAPSPGTYIAFGVKRSVALAKVNETALWGALGFVCSVVIAIVVTRVFGQIYIQRPLSALLSAAASWRKGDWTARALTESRDGECKILATAFNDMADTVARELTDRNAAKKQLQRSHAALVERSQALEAQTARIALLATMSQRLQGCSSEAEIASCVTCFAPQILTGIPGILYVLDQSKTLLRAMAKWNAPESATEEFAVTACWGIRRGHLHSIEDAHNDIGCGHVHAAGVAGYSCRPLIAQGETIGLLYLETGNPASDHAASYDLDVFAENLALALANHRLRESLRSQSIHDPLTGLYNRRYLEEVMELDIARASRSGESFALVMADLDHFKRINDRFGHDAGDLVLTEFAQAVQAQIRKGDVACRYGGEEFIVLVRGADVEAAAARAESIRQAIASLSLSWNGTSIGPVTVSLGVAAYAEHADNPRALVALADGALYAAKRNGRNRVEIARAKCQMSIKAA